MEKVINKYPDSVINSIILPAYNEETCLEDVVQSILEILHNSSIDNFEIIVVDDGSNDDTWNIIKKLSHKSQSVKGIRFSRNFGHQKCHSCRINVFQGRHDCYS